MKKLTTASSRRSYLARLKRSVGSRNMNGEMKVRVHGCVRRQGSVKTQQGATVGDAVQLSGGFGGQGMTPTGAITIRSRRKQDGRYYCRRRLNYLRHSAELKVKLRADDIIVVQFDVGS